MQIIDFIKNNISEFISPFFGAFFAFIFFIIGEKWNEYREERKEIILYLDRIKRIFAFQIIPIESNIFFAESIIKSIESITINVGRFEYLVKSTDIDVDLIKYRVQEKIIYLIAFSDSINNNINILNSNINILSSISREIMLYGKYDNAKLSMDKNFSEIKEKTENILNNFKDLKNKLIPELIDEIHFTSWYINRNFIIRKVIDFKVKKYPEYRQRKIKELSENNKNVSDSNETKKQ